MSSTSSISNESNKPTVQAPATTAAVASPDLSPKDNLARKDALVVLSTNSQALGEELVERPEIESPEQFKSKKNLVKVNDLPDYFTLLATQQKKDLEQKRDNLDTRQKSTAAVMEAKKKANLQTNQKISEQADSQQKSSAKSGFLSVFTRVFSGITFAIGAVMMAVPGLQLLGVALMVSGAIGIATSFPEVTKAFGDLITKILTPVLGQDLAKTLGPILAAFYIAGAQVATMIVVPNPTQITSAVNNVLSALKSISSLKTLATYATITQTVVSAGMQGAISINNLNLADITKALDSLNASSELFSTQLNNLIDALNRDYQNMADSARKYAQQIDDTPKIAIA